MYFVYWKIGEKPKGPGASADENGLSTGLDGVGQDWVQPFVKGLCLGLRQAGNERQLWIAAGPHEYMDNWVRAQDFIDTNEFMPAVSPLDIGRVQTRIVEI